MSASKPSARTQVDARVVHEATEFIGAAVTHHRFAAAELERAAEVRDRAISEGAAVGLTRRQLAELSGLTPGRVQQIIARGLPPRRAASARFLG
jgi:hypothetical protein